LSEGVATTALRNTSRRNRSHDKQVVYFSSFQQRTRVMHSNNDYHLKLSTKGLWMPIEEN
ncbi:hypothetical protein GIB67_022554, partial [Kingdonia uniflora]